jgi:hypothetical protein
MDSNTCWDWHFFVLDDIIRYLRHIISSCSLSSLTFWKPNGLVLSPVANFFVKSPTWVEVCVDSNICSFKCHANTFPLMFWGMHLVINSSYHTYISFILSPLPYNIMYPSWLVISYNCPFFMISMWLYHWRYKYPFVSMPCKNEHTTTYNTF